MTVQIYRFRPGILHPKHDFLRKIAKIKKKLLVIQKKGCIFAFGFGIESDGPGRFPVKKQTMTYEFINSIEKTNGTNRYDISISHIVYDHDVNICFGKHPEFAREFFRVQYSWKNAKRSMFNLTLKATKTLAESEKLMAKKIIELEEKIK